jgi:hypothetical protein
MMFIKLKPVKQITSDLSSDKNIEKLHAYADVDSDLTILAYCQKFRKNKENVN